MNSVRLIGLMTPKKSYLVIGGFLITSKFPRTWLGYFIPTSVVNSDLLGIDLMVCKWRLDKLNISGTASFDKGIFDAIPYNKG